MFLTPVVLTLAVAGPVFVDVAVNMIILFVDSGNPGDETTRAFAVPPSVPEKAIPPHADPASITFPDTSDFKQSPDVNEPENVATSVVFPDRVPATGAAPTPPPKRGALAA